MPENKSYLDNLAASSKPESFSQENFVPVNNSNKRVKLIVTSIVIAVLLVGAYFLYTIIDSVKVPTLVGMTLTDATDWAQKNKITLSAKNSYDFATDEGTIISQEIKAGDKIRKNSTITIGVSLGADPDEAITFPDVTTMTASQIETWISDNKLTGVKIVTANSDVVEVDHVISYTLTDDTEANFKRKSRATINVSLGPKSLATTVVVIDFSSKKAGEVLQWGTDNNVTIKLEESFDDYIAAGYVISQSVKVDTEIKRTEPITVYISVGKSIIVPNFAAMSIDEANAWAKLNGVTLTTQERYSSSNNKGTLYAQSIAAGSSMKASDELKLTYSIGRVDVASYIGKTKLELVTWQNTVNAKQANIHLNFSTAYGEKGSADKIISQSIKNDFVSPGTTINVVVSLGMKLLTPDFSKLTMAECTALGQSAGVTILYNYQYSTTVANGMVIGQSPARNTVMTDAKPVVIVISSNSKIETVTVPDFSTMRISAITQWQADNKVSVVMKEVYSDSVSAGNVVYQSVAKNTIISKATTIYLKISKGPAPTLVKVPTFSSMSVDDANLWAKTNNITLVYKNRYSNTVAKGSLFNQSVAAGTSIDQGSAITISCSLGKVDVASYIGKTKLDLLNWLSDINTKGANITPTYTYGYGDEGTSGKIIGQSIVNDYVNTGTTINFVISLGKKIVVPNLLAPLQNQAGCQSICSSLGMKILFNYQYSSSVAVDYVISQSEAAGSIISDADTVTIVISLGPNPTP